MADAKHLLEFLEGGVGVLFNMGAEFFRVEFAPGAPARLRWQRPFLGGGQIPVNRTAGQIKPPGGFDLGTTVLDEFHDSFPQVQRISFHAHIAYQAMSQCQCEML
jgi:hypothetical protein